MILLLQELLHLDALGLTVLSVVVSSGLAALSYEVLEMPIRRSPRLNRFSWRIPAWGLAASAVVAVVLTPAVLEQSSPPAVVHPHLGGAHEGDRTIARCRRTWTGRRSSRTGDRRHCTEAPECVTVEGRTLTSCSSVTARPAASPRCSPGSPRTTGFRLSINMMAGCFWQADVVNTRVPSPSGEVRPGATEWYDEVLPELDPDLVVLVSAPFDIRGSQKSVDRVGGSDETNEELLVATTEETIDRFREAGVRPLIVQSTLRAGGDGVRPWSASRPRRTSRSARSRSRSRARGATRSTRP